GQVLWVTDDGSDEVFVYDTAGALLGRWRLDARNADASGVTKDPTGASNDLWVVDRADRAVYRYAAAAGWRGGSRAAADTCARGAGNQAPEGTADPPTLTVSAPQEGDRRPAGTTLLITGQAGPDPSGLPSSRVVAVTVNGTPVEALDPAGTFFTRAT